MLHRVVVAVGLALLVPSVVSSAAAAESPAAAADWRPVKAPEVWKSPPKGSQGYSWYRCLVFVPESWMGRDLELFVEPVDDAREFYLNGAKVGGAGAFPPAFRSGLGDPDRHSLRSSAVRFGSWNTLAIRVYDSHARGGFNVAAPVLFGGTDAIRMEGTWQFRPGDDLSWGTVDEPAAAAELQFTAILPAAEVNRILRKLPGEIGPLAPGDTLAHFKTSAGLAVDLVLSEPEVGQPLSIKFDERGRLWVAQYLQYPNPAGLKTVSHDKFLRAVYDKVPPPPPHHFRGQDRISIHEDTDGDGVWDRHRTFIEGLSLMTSFERGRGGVWVLNPPYLLFYPDRDGDDIPDEDPEVHLQGFGLEDSHSLANNLRWGPDGWLYGAQGSTVTGHITRPGDTQPPVHSLGQLIWRYHPEQRRYEVFAEGGGNTFGVEIDAQGRIFSGHNGGDTRGFHYVQGGYYQKGFGKHGALSNPYTFGYFPAIAHHSVPRFTHTFVIYEGGALPADYQGKLFGVGPLQSHVVYSEMQPQGSTVRTRDVGHALTTDDTWFRPVDIQVGPDGALYVADMYEQRIDHASHYQGRVDKASGRIYRLRSADPGVPLPPFDLGRATPAELVAKLAHPNKWFRQTALRLIADRNDPQLVPLLQEQLAQHPGPLALEFLWALNLCGGLSEEQALKALDHAHPQVRLWTARLVCDDGQISPALATRLVDLARFDTYVEVRSQLACSARRLPAAPGLAVVKALLAHAEDLQDPHVPLLLWWAIEAKAETDRQAVETLFEDPELWKQPLVEKEILERLMRRYAQAGTRKDLLTCARLLTLAPEKRHVQALLDGFEKAFEGRLLTGLPEELTAAMAARGGGSLALRLRQAEPEAVQAALAALADDKAKRGDRLLYAQILGQIHQASAVPVLLSLAESSSDSELRSAALTALQAFDTPEIGETVVQLYSRLPEDARSAAQTLLASRAGWTRSWLAAVDSGRIAAEQVPLPIVRRMLLHRDPAIAELVKKHWGELQGVTTEEMKAQLDRLVQVLGSAAGNPYQGKTLFRAHCGKCHVLFDEGGRIGPDLTAYKRDDLHNMLLNIVNPNIQIREGFENFIVVTEDGRTLSGFIADQDNRVVALRSAEGQTMVIPRQEIDDMQASPQSIMPEGLLKSLDEQQLRDLFAYLRATQPLPD